MHRLIHVRNVTEHVAISFSNAFTYTALSAIESGQITRRWWENNKEIILLSLILVAALLITVANAAVKVIVWVWRNADRMFSLDGDLCPCWGQRPDWSEVDLLETPAMDQEISEFVNLIHRIALA